MHWTIGPKLFLHVGMVLSVLMPRMYDWDILYELYFIILMIKIARGTKVVIIDRYFTHTHGGTMES